MYAPINEMPDSSRVWIYQSGKNLTPDEVQLLSKELERFCSQWQVHGAPMRTSFSVDDNRFIVLAVDEQEGSPSGCSIDSSVHILKSLEQQFQTDFFSRQEVAFYEHGTITTFPLTSLKKQFNDGILKENSVTLNTLVQTLGDWRHNRMVPVKDSWLRRYIPKVPVS